jgi:GMP synthase-like glutamine amidotransferase
MNTADPGSRGRVVVFRHVPFEGAGLIAPALEQRGFPLEYADLYRDEAELPDVAAAAGLIFLGGPMSVNDPLPYLQQESDLIRQAIDRGQPVMGVCLGSQLIAKTLGARVYRNPVKEIGWYDLHFTEAGRADAILSGIDNSETVFHWHGETFDVPAAAERLAYSEDCANQAFRFGRNVYGLQFHLEVTPAMIEDWCMQEENCGDIRELGSPPDPWHNQPRLEWLAAMVFGHWCDLLSEPRA